MSERIKASNELSGPSFSIGPLGRGTPSFFAMGINPSDAHLDGVFEITEAAEEAMSTRSEIEGQ